MCCCAEPNVNGTLGYRWQPQDTPSIRSVNPPPLGENDVLLYDEPGRCGGLDAHCHHYRLVKHFSSYFLLMAHGGGSFRMRLYPHRDLGSILGSLSSNARYWMMATIAGAYTDGESDGRHKTDTLWSVAAAEGRIKKRKVRGQSSVKVTIVPRRIESPVQPGEHHV